MSAKIPPSFSRTLPYVKLLHKSRRRVDKLELLKGFPKHVLNDMIEILYNILIGRVNISTKEKRSLARHKKDMYHFIELPTLAKRRSFIYKQEGGALLTAMLPVIGSVLGNLLLSKRR